MAAGGASWANHAPQVRPPGEAAAVRREAGALVAPYKEKKNSYYEAFWSVEQPRAKHVEVHCVGLSVELSNNHVGIDGQDGKKHAAHGLTFVFMQLLDMGSMGSIFLSKCRVVRGIFFFLI
jgi:hypothetical protein